MTGSPAERSWDWWKSAVVYQIYPRSFADSDGDGIGDLGGIIDRLDHLERLGVDAVWLSPVYRSPMVDNGYDISDYQDVEPLFGSLEQLDELIAAAHARGMRRDHGPGRQPHQRPARVVPGGAVVEGQRATATSTGGARRARATSAVSRGAEPTNWGSAFSGPAWTWDEATGEYYLHLFAPEQPDLNWENPRGARGGLLDDALVARPRRRRLPDGRHQPDLQGTSRLPGLDSRGEADPPAPGVDVTARRSRARTSSTARGSTSSSRRCTARSSPVARPGCSTSGRCPATTRRAGARSTPTADARELDMIFQFEHVDLDSGPGGKWDVVPLPLPRLKADHAALAGRPGRRRLEQPLLEQPRPATRGQPLRQRRPALPGPVGQGARHRAAPAPRDAVRLPGRGARHDQRALRGHRGLPRPRVDQPLPLGDRPRRRPRDASWTRCATRAATTHVRRCSGTPRRTPASPPASRGSRSTRTTPRSTRPRRSTTRTRCSATTAG